MFVRIFLLIFFSFNSYSSTQISDCKNELPDILDLKLVKDKIRVAEVIAHNKMVSVAQLLSKQNGKFREHADKINSLPSF
ncbi:MAG: hypothetical protein U0T83_08105 [Bacteriovoracaceae bacterium]